MKLKQLPLFYKIYLSLLVLFVIFIIVLSAVLNSFIGDYNEGIPETVSENFFQSTFVNLDVDKIIEMSGITPSEFETEQDIKDFIASQLSSDLSYTNISSSDNSNSKRYIVKSDDYKLATFTLSPDENNDYHPTSLELHLPKSYQYTYKILNTSSLQINGIPVSDLYISQVCPHENAKYLPDDVPSPEWVYYSVTGLTKEPHTLVTDRNGNTPLLSETDGILCEQIIYDTPESALVDRLVTAAKQYAKCMQHDASKASVLVYFEKDTDLYNSIRTVENMFVWDHAGYAFEDESTSQFMRYDENTVSVRIAFTHILKKYGREDYRDKTDITYFARNVDGQYLIYDRYNNN